jgi:hypothetical protein
MKGTSSHKMSESAAVLSGFVPPIIPIRILFFMENSHKISSRDSENCRKLSTGTVESLHHVSGQPHKNNESMLRIAPYDPTAARAR